MPYLNKDEFMTRIKERIGEDMSDDAVSFIEDASDTYDELIRRSSDTEDWKTKKMTQSGARNTVNDSSHQLKRLRKNRKKT